ncbi:hypothetical protein GCM10027037_09180 [Mucilaginibacter koreensis]
METTAKHYKFINVNTGNAIYYYTINSELDASQTQQQLETIKAEVAVSNGVFFDNIYWEEIKDEAY